MISEWTIYWITRLDNLSVFLGTSLVMILFFYICASVLYFLELLQQNIKYQHKHLFFIIPPIFYILFASLCLVFIPSTKEMIAIYTIPKIVNNEKLQSELENWYGITKDFLIEKMTVNKKEVVK